MKIIGKGNKKQETNLINELALSVCTCVAETPPPSLKDESISWFDSFPTLLGLGSGFGLGRRRKKKKEEGGKRRRKRKWKRKRKRKRAPGL